MGKIRGGLAAVAVFSFFQNILLLAAPLYMLQVYDRVLTSRSVDTLIFLTLALALALATLATLELVRGRILGRLANWIDASLSAKLYSRGVQNRLRGMPYGVEALGDLATLKGFITSQGMTALFDLPWTPVFIFGAYVLHPYLGHLALGSIGLLLVLGICGEMITRRKIERVNALSTTARRDAEAAVQNAEVVEAMGMMGALAAKWDARSDEALEVQSRLTRRTTTLGAITKFVRLLMQSLGLGLGAWLVIQQEATGGVMIAASIMLTRAAGPIEQVIGAWKSVVTMRSVLARLRHIDREPLYRAETMPLPPPVGDLAVEAVSYVPVAGMQPVLKDICFAIEAGESLAIIGASGSGKSSLARLLAGAVRPTRGTVRLDRADLFTWPREQVGSFVGYLPQDVELFAGSVAENIARFGQASSEQIVAAARVAGVHDLVLSMPQGYDTEIGLGGQHLSGGQKQRIALARAVFGQPRLVILDEPNSNLDTQGEAALVHALAALRAALCTTVIITHRPSLVAKVDKVMVLNQGSIQAFGPREEVLAQVAVQPRRNRPAQRPRGREAAAGSEQDRFYPDHPMPARAVR
nr:type I secretion system permease/ATPase [Devosia oryzisoli]